MQPFTSSDKVEPYPSDYKELVRAYYSGTVDPANISVSPPRTMASWSIYEASGWYVCAYVLTRGMTLLGIFGGRVKGVIPNPAKSLCYGVRYTSLAQ